MSKLSKLLIVGAGVAVANYYTKNSGKLEEHFNLLKKKAKDSYGYTKCMVRYAEKNGVKEAANYLYKDAKKVVKRTKDSIETTYNNTVEYGKDLSNNVAQLKDQAANLKDYTKDVKDNLAVAKEVASDLKPKVDSFVETAKSTLGTIKDQVATIKDEVEASKIQEKVVTFTTKATSTIEEVKGTVEELAPKKAEAPQEEEEKKED